MKMKHKLKRGLAFLLAGGLVLTNLGTALPAFAEESQATPETATSDSAETEETAESAPALAQITDNLYGIQAQYVPKARTIYVRNGMDAGTTLCAIIRECAQADFHKDYTYNRQAYAAPSYCAAYMVAHRYGLDTAAFNFDRVVALYGKLNT